MGLGRLRIETDEDDDTVQSSSAKVKGIREHDASKRTVLLRIHR